MKVVVGSMNKAKVQAVQAVVPNNWIVSSMNASSGVSDQPFSDEETIQGAINRAENALHQTDAQLAIGLEGGVVETPFGLFLCNWAALMRKDNNKVYIAGGARIPLPVEVAKELRKGRELGPVMDEYTNTVDVRSNDGAVGIFTNGKITRAKMFEHIIELLIGQYEYDEMMKIG